MESFKYLNVEYKHGDKVKVTINKQFMLGTLNLKDKGGDGRFFVCQDLQNGMDCADKLGHRYSWAFNVLSNTDLSDGVKLLGHLDFEEPFYISQQNTSLSVLTSDNSLAVNFNFSDYPACCGTQIIHSYGVNYMKKPSAILIKQLLEILDKRSPMLNVIVVKDDQGHKFFTEYLGFNEVTEWTNYSDRGARLVLLTRVNARGV